MTLARQALLILFGGAAIVGLHLFGAALHYGLIL